MSELFGSEARRSFDALAQQFGMSCALCNNWEVRYENASVALVINYDSGRSYDLRVAIGRKGWAKMESPFSLAEILRLRAVADAAPIEKMMISDGGRLPNALARLAHLTSEHAGDFLMGNEFSFAQVAKQRQGETEAYALERDLRAARDRSDVAWKNRDFAGVIKSLEPLESHLSPAERKRLDYSRRQLAS